MNILRTKHRSQWARVCALIWVLALPAAWAQPLAGTQPLTETGDVRMRMLEGLRGFLLRETDASVARRLSYWRQDFSSPEAYARSVAGNRARFARIIGLADHRVGFDDWTPQATLSGSALLAEGPGYRVYAVRWPVLDGVEGEGLLLEPTRPAAATVIALPDADSSPEALAGLAPGTPYSMQIARRLAESGCRVVVPVLIDRQDTYSGSPYAHLTNMAHREMIYRMAYQLGRHIIGYEVQKVLAVVDWAVRRHPGQPVGVAGYGEGGLLALYSAAADPRIDATLVSGYFDARQNLWQEPLYRNVWGLLEEFGDAELAWMIAPRPLVVEACRAPEIAGPPAPSETHRSAGAPGRLTTPEPRSVEDEAARARVVYAKLGEADRLSLVLSGDGRGEPGSEAAMGRFLRTLKMNATRPQGELARRTRPDPDRQRRQFFQLVEYTQKLARQSQFVRQEFWSKANTTSPARWDESAESYRRYLWEEVIGKFPPATEPLVARTRRIYDEPRWTGYEVTLPVWPGVFASGILLIPKNVAAGEQRPVVVCQHGVNRWPDYVVDPKLTNAYNNFAANLANRSFVVYAPLNPYTGEPEFPFRQLQRQANPLKRSIFSIILAQHERTLDWLGSLPFVDPARIAFYGLSYGGETALRVPPLLKRYALSICSGNFSEWVSKMTDFDDASSFLYVGSFDHYDFNMANTFNDGDLANLVAPRPFMVERGHRDGVGSDEWVAYEYAKVRRHYSTLGIPDRTRIEFFEGGHKVNAAGTFKFLHQHLKWPEPPGGLETN